MNTCAKNRLAASGKSALLASLFFTAIGAVDIFAQPAPTTARSDAADRPVAMDFPAEGIELKTLVEIVMKRQHTPILYDDAILNKRVIVRVPVNLPETALMGVLQSALRMKQLALVDADLPGWKQIVPVQNLAAVAKPVGPGVAADAGMAITTLLTVKYIDPAKLLESIKPLSTLTVGNASVLPGQKSLIISDYPSVIKRIEEMIAILDTEGVPMETKFVLLKQADAAAVVPIATSLIAARDQLHAGTVGLQGMMISADERMNQVIVVAPSDRMKNVLEVIAGLDQAVNLDTKVYKLKALSPERLDKLVKNLMGQTANKRSYQATADRESQSLIVSATPEVHDRITAMLKELDVERSEAQSPIRFYKLKNTKAADVLATISGLYGQGAEPGSIGSESDSSDDKSALHGPAKTGMTTATGTTPANTNSGTAAGTVTDGTNRNTPNNLSSLQRLNGDGGNSFNGGSGTNNNGSRYNPTARSGSGDFLNSGSGAGGAVHAKNATVAADTNSNSIIVIAPPAVQQSYAEIIHKLDERRPQVQIECTIVTLDTTNGQNFAVDIAQLGGFAANKVLTFSSFGVASVDIKTGNLTPAAATGGTAALLSPRIADVAIRALATHSRARLVSAPQLLVNDNGKGKLQSVNQQPFAEILDTSSNQSRTGLGGQAEAGTTITVEPHISQDDYLQLLYSIELSNFTGAAAAGLPPPSHKSTIDSTVTIPDGYTIVVGGLNQKNFTQTKNSLPIIEKIPVLNLLFGGQSTSNSDTTLFVFIRPVILRDDKFDDLKYLSEHKLQKAGLAGPYPTSEPIPLR